MSKEHQFIVKSIVRGDRTPMYLETYTLGDRSSQVYKDAMKLLGSENAQQEVSVELAVEATNVQNSHRNSVRVNNRPMSGTLHVNDIDPDTRLPTGVRNRLITPNTDYGDPAGQVDLSMGGILGYVSPGQTLARELEERYPNKNWKGRANKAFETYIANESKYSKQDIAICLLNLHPSRDMETKYRELLDLEYPMLVSPVRGDLLIEHDRLIRINKASQAPSALHLKISSSEENPAKIVEGVQTGFETYVEKVGGVLLYGEELKEGSDHLTVIPLENNLRAWVKTDVLNSLVSQAVDQDWVSAKLRRKVEHLFNQIGGEWYSVVEGWFNTAMDVERASRGEQQASPVDSLSSPLVKQLRDDAPNILSDQTLVDSIHLMFAKGTAADEQVVHAIFEVLGYPNNYAEFIAGEKSCTIPQELRALCLERFGMTEEPPRSFVADLRYRYHPTQLDDMFLISRIDSALQGGKLTLPDAVASVMEVMDFPETAAAFSSYVEQCDAPLSTVLYQACVNEYTPVEGPKPVYVLGNSETQEITSVTQSTYYRHEQFEDHVAFGTTPGSRSQQEIIGVLAYAIEANENEPDCVSVMHYQFFYQGDSVFVTDRYGNTVDRLR